MSKEIDDHILDIYDVKNFLGSGAYGHVWRVIKRKTNKEYALKKIFDAFQNAVDGQRTYRQISMLHELSHQNVIKLQWVMKAKNNKDLYLVFEYLETDLHAIIGQNILGSTHIRFVLYQMAKALKYLHSTHLIHRDLKSSNVLINTNCQIKICDFGLVRSLTTEEHTSIVLSEDVATRWYRSPEMLMGSQSYGKPTDIWSLGCIIAELITGQPLFPGTSTLNQLQRILEFTGIPSHQNIRSLASQSADHLIDQIRVKRKSLKSYFKEGDPEILAMVMKMLEFNPAKRITAEGILQLPELQEFRGKSEEEICKKCIIPQVDDNVRLKVEDYRRLIYRDIQRRYPEYNQTNPSLRFLRGHHSLTSKQNNLDARRHASNSLIKVQKKKPDQSTTSLHQKYSKYEAHNSLQDTANTLTRFTKKQKCIIHAYGPSEASQVYEHQQKQPSKLIRRKLKRKDEFAKQECE